MQSQNDYLRKWLLKFKDYLNLLIAREAPPRQRSCSICVAKDGVYRCHGCFGEPLFCTDCCRTQHRRHPFHRISQWTGTFFQHTSLTKIGLDIHLGHGGDACPNCAESDDDIFNWDDQNDEADEDDRSDLPQEAGIPTVTDKPTTTIVDKSGVHLICIRYCDCPGALSHDKQLFHMGMFPASFNRPKTAFTFAVLDDFLLDNLECGTSAMNYYSKLRRLTDSIFPLLVPVRTYVVQYPWDPFAVR